MFATTTEPGFSSRSTEHHASQFPQRDGLMSEMEQEAGWSNSDPADHAPESVYPDVAEPEELDPGFSNDKAVGTSEAVESKVVDEPSTEDKSVKPAAKKATAKKKG